MKKQLLKLSLALILTLCSTFVWAGNFTITSESGENNNRIFIIRRADVSTVQQVSYRTVSLSALEGKHFTPVSGTLTFDIDEDEKMVPVKETLVENIDLLYSYQQSSNRSYRFEVLDENGVILESLKRDLSYGSSYNFSNAYVSSSITDLVYLNNGNFNSNLGNNKYFDVSYSPSTNSQHTMVDGYIKIDDQFAYNDKTLCRVPTSSFFSHTGGSQEYLNAIGNKMYATVCFTQKESYDGYQYIQILTDNFKTCDGEDDNGVVSDPATSLYKACLELKEDKGAVTTDHKAFYPHRYNCHNRTACGQTATHTEFDHADGCLWEQKYNNSSYDADNNGALKLATTVDEIDIRFDANGKDEDTWFIKNLFVRFAMIDETAPTALNNIVVSNGIYMSGNNVRVSIPFSEIVNVYGPGNNNYLETSWGRLYYEYGGGTNVLTFKGTISGEPGTLLKINGFSGTIKDMSNHDFTWSGTKTLTQKITTSYTISYELNEGTGATNPTKYCKESLDITLKNPTREGFIFLGWTGSNGDTPQTTVTIAHNSTGNKSYTANWYEIVPEPGTGTADDPFILRSESDWMAFAESINNGINTDAYYKMYQDITLGTENEPISIIVGTMANHFKGHFDGDGHTLTVYMDRTELYAAPFGIADGATFTNLNIEGTITTTNKFAGGIASYVYGRGNGAVNVINCNSNINIVSTVTAISNGDGTHAGFVGQCENGTINFENCVFTGNIIDTADPKVTIKCAGFLGWVNDSANYVNCLQAGTIDVKANMATFHRKANKAKISFENAYYIHGFNDNQGVQVTSSLDDNNIGKRFVLNTTEYYLPGVVVTGIKTSYAYAQGDVIAVTPVLTYFGEVLTENEDYTVAFQRKNGDIYENIDENGIAPAGDYKVIISGTNDFAGTYTALFKVKNIAGNWVDLQTAINSSSEIVLDKDYTAGDEDAALIVNGTVTIDLNGHSIDRNLSDAVANGYVIKVNEKGSLTIIDSSKEKTGEITGGNTIGNGGGIYNNKGTLTIENINITGNRCVRDGKAYGTGAGIYSTGSVTMTNCNVNNNNADGGGGGIHTTARLTISGGNVCDNRSNSKGAGIRAGGTTEITNCNISGNRMKGDGNVSKGGGVFLDGTTDYTSFILTGCTITNNFAIEDGGGIFLMRGNALVKDCNISGNTSNTYGNDIFLYLNTILSIEGNYENTDKDNIYICNNAQLYIPTNANVSANIQKNADAWVASSKTGWSPIASPVANMNFQNVTNLLSTTHNIYRYDAGTATWHEYRDAEEQFNSFEKGRGYLYRRANTSEIIYSGTLNSGDVYYNLEYTEGDALRSYNLIGNPYSHNIYKGKNISNDFLEEKYCVMNADGTWEVMDDSDAIPVGLAILVQAKEAKALKITNEAESTKERSNNDNIWFTVTNDEFRDKVCVEFKNGHGFNKVAHRNENAPMLFINHNGENFASVDMSDDTEVINLNFKANKTGRYTLSYNAKGNFSYLHLIDRLTGNDIDLLLDEEYSFVASSKDSEARFLINLKYQSGNTGSDIFAYQNGSDIIVNGEGTLQIFDVTGRLVNTAEVNSVETMSTSALQTGVYVFRLVGNEVKTQKIVVR